MKSITTFIGWLLLAVILAVPAFLFYNWWMNKKAVQLKENTAISNSTAIPFESDAEDFYPVETGTASVASEQELQARESGLNQEEEPEFKADEQPYSQQKLGAFADILPSSSPVNTQMPESGGALKVSSPSKSEIAQPSFSTITVASGQPEAQERKGSYFEPKSDRDPTMSPAEYAQIKKEIAARKERERQRRLAELRKKNSNSIQNQLTLQGVVGNNVIINGEMYSVGSYVKGVKIVKIGANYFIGSHKGKKFKKVMR